MQSYSVGDLDLPLLGRRLGAESKEFGHPKANVSGRGFLLLSDHEQVRDSAIRYMRENFALTYLDYNAEPQSKRISEMCAKAYGYSYESQKQAGPDFSFRLGHTVLNNSLVIDNFQDIGLLANREAKLALAYLRSLGRKPFDITVICVGAEQDSLDLLKLDEQLGRVWATIKLVDQ